MIKRYEALSERARWFLFLPLFLLPGAGMAHLLREIFLGILGDSTISHAMAACLQAVLITAWAYYLIPRGKIAAAWIYASLSVGCIWNGFDQAGVPPFEAFKEMGIAVLFSPTISPYTFAAIGSIACAFFIVLIKKT